MSIFSKLKTTVSEPNYRSVDYLTGPVLDYKVENCPRMSDIPLVERYILSVTLGINFSCPRGSLAEATKSAERKLLYDVYNEVVAKLHDIRHAAYAGDRNEILRLCDELEEELTK